MVDNSGLIRGTSGLFTFEVVLKDLENYAWLVIPHFNLLVDFMFTSVIIESVSLSKGHWVWPPPKHVASMKSAQCVPECCDHRL